MNSGDDFSEVLDILKIHGDEIMMAFYGNECRINLERDLGDEFEEAKDQLVYYSCYEGGEFFPLLFSVKNYNQRTMLDETQPKRPAFQKGFIYHCLIETRTEENQYSVDQNHYFTLFMGERTILFQTYGGTRGILVKYVHSNVNAILGKILEGQVEYYRLLFEVPEEMKHVLAYKYATLKYVSQNMVYPSLRSLDKILREKGLDFAAKKLDYYI